MNGLSMKLFPSRTLVVLALAAVTWAATARAEAGDENGIRWTNGLKTADLRFNALATNTTANPRMIAMALHTATYTTDAYMHLQLEDPSARKFLEYTVSCALMPGQFVSFTDRAGIPYQFEGRIGLCPSWSSGSASLECQRWVSACVLARNNAEGERVLLSGRGLRPADSAPFIPKPEVATDLYNPLTQNRVASTLQCDPFEVGVHRNCGFQPERIGMCRKGERVQIGGGGVPADFTCDHAPLGETLEGTMVLRVCEGFHACNGLKALAQSAITCSNYRPAVSFTCPDSGVFNVMSGSRNSAEPGKMRVESLNVVAYPASELQLFTHREGAFYGNIWGPGAIAAGVNVYVNTDGQVVRDIPAAGVSGSVYPRMFACQDKDWDHTDAYATARLCTMPGQNCVANPVGRCDEVVTAGSYTGKRCQIDNATGLKEYAGCVSPGGMVFQEVVTPLLNRPCDSVTDAYACSRESLTIAGSIPPGVTP